MRLTRCHVVLPLAQGRTFALPEAAANHLARVLRLREGDECVLFNGDGQDHVARLLSVGKREVQVEVVSSLAVDRESPLRLTLIQGIARGEKMDLILQKATELGIARIQPVNAERTEVKLDAERLDKRVAHWRSVVVSACEQSGRTRIPEVSMPATLMQAAQACDSAELRLLLDPVGEQSLAGLSPPTGAGIAIAIGPEGGWSPRDREILLASGFLGLRLGPRILRTETAGLAAIAALQSRFGDLA
ncbi:16S rRNA (uracil(1498)-N(3))-methyltransferase [Pseudoxanthomonas beigongshangi]